MSRQIAFALVVAGTFAFGWLLGQNNSGTAHAQTWEITVPKSFGILKGAMPGSLIFEDGAGVIRVISFDKGKVESTITRK